MVDLPESTLPTTAHRTSIVDSTEVAGRRRRWVERGGWVWWKRGVSWAGSYRAGGGQRSIAMLSPFHKLMGVYCTHEATDFLDDISEPLHGLPVYLVRQVRTSPSVHVRPLFSVR